MGGWSGFTLTGEKVDEPADELERKAKLMNPKSYISLLKTM
ncbi:MAG: hypothetical protein RMI85_03945 [Candidatus Korarchaeum sp.]|nr:hypothetical protein [Candidatus Korarchaeum sp.]